MLISTKGLLLKLVPYLGQKKILKVFTLDHGMLSFFTSSTKLTPFCLIECVFRKTEKEMYQLHDTSLIDPLLNLREDYEVLQAAGYIAQKLLKTQMPHKTSPELFDLCYFYLKKLALKPEALKSSFALKLLLHEGLLSEEQDPLFTLAEWQKVQTLTFSRSLSTIAAVGTLPSEKIEALFEERIGH